MEPQIVAAIIGPACTALLAVLGIAIKNVQTQRRSHGSRERDMRVAGQTVTFIDAYLAAYEKLGTDAAQQALVRERATRDLEGAYQTMVAAAHEEQQSEGRTDWTGVVKSALLIPVHRPAARVVRAFYYCTLVYALFTSALFIGVAFAEDQSSQSWSVSVGTVIILVGVNILPALLLHKWARRLESSVTWVGPAHGATAETAIWPRPTGRPTQPPPVT